MKIIHTKFTNNFRVRFEGKIQDHYSEELSYSKDLSDSIVSVSPLLQSREENLLTSMGVTSASGSVSLTFDDDVLNKCCDALQKLWDESEFKIIIELLDRNENVLRTYRLFKCSVQRIVHSGLDFTKCSSRVTKIVDVEYRVMSIL